MGGPLDTFVVRLVLVVSVVAWASVLVHDLVTPDAAEESLAPATASDGGGDAQDLIHPTTVPSPELPTNATPTRGR